MYINKINEIREKYKEFNRLLGNDSDSNSTDVDRECVAESIDDLLFNWEADFSKEINLRKELHGVLAKLENSAESIKLLDVRAFPTKQSNKTLDRVGSIACFLIDKDETIERYEQRLEIQHAEMINCDLSSKYPTSREGRDN